MAISTANASWVGTGPAADEQVLGFGGSSYNQLCLIGSATVTGDGASSTFDVNFIDGTADLSFTPSAVIAFRTGGAATATIAIVSTSGITTKKFTVNTSANVNAATFTLHFLVIK